MSIEGPTCRAAEVVALAGPTEPAAPARVDRRCTATARRSTTTSPRSSTCGCAFAARQLATARVLDAEAGECDLEPLVRRRRRRPGPADPRRPGRVRDARRRPHRDRAGRRRRPAAAAGRSADELVERVDGWRALCPTRLALLDAEFAERVRPWPQIGHALLRRAERRTADLDVLRAITCQPRLEVRLVLLLWHLAARWGRVEPAGSA